MSTRNYEAIVGVFKAINDPIVTRTDLCTRHQPYDVPISRLLRIERDRGFKDGHNHGSQPCMRRSTPLLDNSGVTFGVYHADVGGQRSHSPHPPSHGLQSTRRQFSTQTAHQRPPPKRPPPPPPPPRKPPVPLRGPLNDNAAPADLLSRISPIAKTGEAFDRQDENEQERLRHQKMQEEQLTQPWWAAYNKIESQAREHFELKKKPPSPREYLSNELKRTQRDAWREIERGYKDSEQKVNDLRKRYVVIEEDIRLFPERRDANILQAQEEDRMRCLWEQYKSNSGLRAAIEQVDFLELLERTLRREVADLKYTIHWRAWNERLMHFRLEQAISVSRELKATGSIHHDSNNLFEDLTSHTEKIAAVLRRLENYLNTSHSLIPRPRLEIYVGMLSVPYYSWINSSYAAWGHIWRRVDRVAVVASRMPELETHSLIDLDVDVVKMNVRNGTMHMKQLVRILNSQLSQSSSQLSAHNTHQRLARLIWSHSTNIHDWLNDYVDFLQEGVLMLNPAMASESGQLKYAALQPFSAYHTSNQTVVSTMRHLAENFEQEGEIKEKDQPTLFQWLRGLNKALDRSKKLQRPMYEDFAAFTYMLNARILIEDIPWLRTRYTQMNEQVKITRQRQQAFEKLSSRRTYRNSDQSEIVIDPARISGNDDLYPSKNSLPVEYVTSGQPIEPVLEELSSEKVLGVELWSRFGTPNLVYAAIASTKKVVVIECPMISKTRTGLPPLISARILEDDSIIKVFLNKKVLMRVNMDMEVALRSVVFLDDGHASKRIKHVRKVAARLRGEVLVDQQFSNPLPCFLSDVAYCPMFNLITFLNAATPQVLVNLAPMLRTNILEAREQLRGKLAQDMNSELQLGNVTWDHSYASSVLENPRWGLATSVQNSFTTVVTSAASRSLKRLIPGLEKPETIWSYEKALAAYYMFTTFGKELSVINQLLGLENAAASILAVEHDIPKLGLMLHRTDREALRKAVPNYVAESEPTTALLNIREYNDWIKSTLPSDGQKGQTEGTKDKLIGFAFGESPQPAGTQIKPRRKRVVQSPKQRRERQRKRKQRKAEEKSNAETAMQIGSTPAGNGQDTGVFKDRKPERIVQFTPLLTVKHSAQSATSKLLSHLKKLPLVGTAMDSRDEPNPSPSETTSPPKGSSLDADSDSIQATNPHALKARNVLSRERKRNRKMLPITANDAVATSQRKTGPKTVSKKSSPAVASFTRTMESRPRARKMDPQPKIRRLPSTKILKVTDVLSMNLVRRLAPGPKGLSPS